MEKQTCRTILAFQFFTCIYVLGEGGIKVCLSSGSWFFFCVSPEAQTQILRLSYTLVYPVSPLTDPTSNSSHCLTIRMLPMRTTHLLESAAQREQRERLP